MIRDVAFVIGLLSLALPACGSATDAPIDDSDPRFIKGFKPTDRPGFTRYIAPPIRDIQPGTDQMWCQWLAAAADEDVDILELEGDQSNGGHHAILYATTIASPVGTTRECRDEDLASVRYLGAIGGEGISGELGRLPAGVVYRLPKGYALMANVHYLNIRTTPIDGQAVLDIKTSPVDLTRQVASLFVNIDVEVEVGVEGTTIMDTECEMKEDLNIFWFGNHMHERGQRAETHVTRVNGTVDVMREDKTWAPEAAFNPVFTRWPLDAPFVLHRGDVVHTHCEWENTLGEPIFFPTEMCAGFAFYVGSGVQHNCIKGTWTD